MCCGVAMLGVVRSGKVWLGRLRYNPVGPGAAW